MNSNPLGYLGTPDFDHARAPTDGVLITNLGTPDAPTPAAVRRYLAEFLWDPRVVERPRWLWWAILHGIILRVRPRRSAAAYREVWTEAGSPLLEIAQRQRAALERALAERGTGTPRVVLGMRYGNPSIGAALGELHAAGVTRLLVLPLYPQYSAATTGSTFDALSAQLRRWRWLPELRFVASYHDEPGYIEALVASVREHRARTSSPRHLLFSFHGLPRTYLDAGDPYHCQCHKTARLVAEALGLEQDAWSIAFQSRVGPERWLEPYTEEHLEGLARDGVAHVDVLCPGFSADCLETLEEIAIRAREVFERAGGSRLDYVPALNDRSDHIGALAGIITRITSDWPATRPDAPFAARARSAGAVR